MGTTKGHRKLTWKNRKWANISVYNRIRDFWRLFHQYLCDRSRFLLWIWDPRGAAMMLTSIIFIYGEHTKFSLQRNYSQTLTYTDLVRVTAIDSRIQKDTLLISQIQTEGHKIAPCSCHRYIYTKEYKMAHCSTSCHRWWDADWSTQNDSLFMS